MKKIILVLTIACTMLSMCMAQSTATISPDKAKTDSLTHAKMIADSVKMEKLLATAQYPYIKGGKWSGVIPVADPSEIPEPKREYKLLFELIENNPDSLAKDINSGLDEVARILNLHIASGIPASNIKPVVVIHGPGLEALMTNERYQKKHTMDNPNLKIIKDLENVGTRFIACGQAMAFHELTKADLLPEIKISITAQTVLSNYQLQGFVLYPIKSDK